MQAREPVPEGMAPAFGSMRRCRQWAEWLGILGLAAAGLALWLWLAAGVVGPLGEALASLDAAGGPPPAGQVPGDALAGELQAQASP